MSLNMFPFQQCCGITIISNFGGTTTGSRGYDNATKSEIKNKIAEFRRTTATGLHLIALNEEQIKHFEPQLLEEGFIKWGSKFYHANHGNWLQLYGWTRYDKNGNKVSYNSSPNVKEIKESSLSPRGVFNTFWTDNTIRTESVPDRPTSSRARVEVPLSTRGSQRSVTPRPRRVLRPLRSGGSRPTE